MHGTSSEASDANVGDLVEFLKMLRPPPSLGSARHTRNTAARAWGKRVFEEQDCVRCHRPPAYTSLKTYDVGTPDKKG
jgi:hypothetical protein